MLANTIYEKRSFLISACEKVVHYCQYGMRWVKPTLFLMWGEHVHKWRPKICQSMITNSYYYIMDFNVYESNRYGAKHLTRKFVQVKLKKSNPSRGFFDSSSLRKDVRIEKGSMMDSFIKTCSTSNSDTAGKLFKPSDHITFYTPF